MRRGYNFTLEEWLNVILPYYEENNKNPLEELINNMELERSVDMTRFIEQYKKGKEKRPNGKRKSNFLRDLGIYFRFIELTTAEGRDGAIRFTIAEKGNSEKMPDIKVIPLDEIQPYHYLTHRAAFLYLSKVYNLSRHSIEKVVNNIRQEFSVCSKDL